MNSNEKILVLLTNETIAVITMHIKNLVLFQIVFFSYSSLLPLKIQATL